MKKNYLKKWLAMTLALTMTLSSSGLAVLAAEEPEEAAVTQAAADPAEESGPKAAEAAQEETVEKASPETVEEASPETVEEAAPEAEAEAAQEESAAEAAPEAEEEAAAEEIAAEAADQADEEEDSEAGATESAGEAAGESDEAYAGEPDVIEEPAEAGAQNDLVLDAEDPAVIAATAIEIAGKTYAYADVSEAPEGSDFTITIDGEEHKKAEFTAIGDTGIVYYSADPLSGSLYGTDSAQVTSYTDFYNSKGVNAKSADYDVITSATAFSGYHAKDISPLIARSEDGITGIYDSVEVDAVTYAEASILKEAGKTLTPEQEKVIAVTLNEDPAVNPEAAGKTVAVANSSYGYSCRYGDGEFIINPDDTVEGFVWSDYKDALYAATVSDGTNTAGAVWWIDLYGESATQGPHYNKVEIAINNGTSKGSNQATVNRYASMYNSEKQELKAGTYTVTLYARGYNTVSTEIEVLSSFDGEVTAALSADKTAVELAGIDGMENPKATVTRTEGSGRQAKTFTYASNADVVDGKVALDTSENQLKYTTYTVTINCDNYSPTTATFAYEPQEVMIAGVKYYWMDQSALIEGAENVTIGGAERAVSDFTQIGETGIAYYSENPLTGKLYGIDESKVTSYTELYSGLGVNASAADYDVITSATSFSGYHVKDISPLVARNADGITGVMLGDTEIDAQAYVEATVLGEAGKALTQEQATLIAITLNTDPAADPATNVKAVKVGSASYGYSCKYGDGEFIINPDDTVEGFVWSDYKDALYAATVSDGTNTAGAVWWIDLYGESATQGPHYNKVEIAINNGTSKGSNQATVNRYAAMYNSEKEELKAGTYTVTLYAKGYETVSAQIEVLSSYDGEVTAALSADKASVELTGIDSFVNPKATVTRTEGTGRQAKTFTYASNADVVDGKVALDTSENELVAATYTVTVNSDNYAPVTAAFDYDDSQQDQVLACDTSTPVVNGRTQAYTVEGTQGALTCEVADPGMATVTMSGTKVTVKGLKPGTTKLIVKAAEAAGYKAAEAEFDLRIVPGKVTKGEVFNLAQTMKITWEAVPGAKYYKVYRDGTFVASTSALVAYDKAKLVNGRKYTYKIVASTTKGEDSSGDSPLSYSKTRCRLTNVDLKAPKNTAAGKVTVNYNKAAVGDSYVIQWSEKKDMSNAKTKVIKPGSTTSYVIGGLKKGKTYYFQLRVRYGSDYTTFGTIRQVRITK